MGVQFENLAKAVSSDGQVDPREVLALRREGWGDGQITRAEAEAIFAINNSVTGQDPVWVDFFVEAIGEYVLNGTEPRLMCNQEEAEWLIAQIDHDGRLESMAELEAVVRIVERAQNVPETLKNYALTQIEAAVLNGTGPTRCGGHLSANYVGSAECAILRRLVFSSGGYGPAAVSRFDAEMLFRIKDATLGGANALEWQKLFVDGVGNYLRGFALKNAQLDHARAKELQDFIADDSVSVGRFFGRMAAASPQVHNHFGKVFGKRDAVPGYTAQAAAGANVTTDERNWLDAQVADDGQIDPLEQALMASLADLTDPAD